MPEQGAFRQPEDLTADTLGTLGLDGPLLSEDYTWQQLESAARRFESDAKAIDRTIEELQQQQRELLEKAKVYREASQLAMPPAEEL